MSSSEFRFVDLLPSIVAMACVILLSNVLVQIPVNHIVQLNGKAFNLADLLTWGAFSYPLAFLVTDTTNRIYGLQAARKVIYVGFGLGVVLSLMAAFGIAREVAEAESIGLLVALTTNEDAAGMLRIALASGLAFIIGQLLDVAIFDKFRAANWWKAPTISSFFGSLTDTVIFFSLAFAGSGLPWVNWAIGDFCIKLLMVALLLYPFRLIVSNSTSLKTAG